MNPLARILNGLSGGILQHGNIGINMMLDWIECVFTALAVTMIISMGIFMYLLVTLKTIFWGELGKVPTCPPGKR